MCRVSEVALETCTCLHVACLGLTMRACLQHGVKHNFRAASHIRWYTVRIQRLRSSPVVGPLPVSLLEYGNVVQKHSWCVCDSRNAHMTRCTGEGVNARAQRSQTCGCRQLTTEQASVIELLKTAWSIDIGDKRMATCHLQSTGMRELCNGDWLEDGVISCYSVLIRVHTTSCCFVLRHSCDLSRHGAAGTTGCCSTTCRCSCRTAWRISSRPLLYFSTRTSEGAYGKPMNRSIKKEQWTPG